jgi:hypothetical protein
MERQLDFNQSGQIFVNGQGPFSPEESSPSSETEAEPSTLIDCSKLPPDPPPPSPVHPVPVDVVTRKTTAEQTNDRQAEVLIEKKSSKSSGGEPLHQTIGNLKTFLSNLKSIDGTHIHIKASQYHVCSNAPFPNFYDDAFMFTDRTDFVKQKIFDLINSENYPSLDQIIRAFIDDNADLLEICNTKFSYSTAKILFNFQQQDQFYYACLTTHDCNLLRIALLAKFNINNCECNGQNCFDMSRITSLPIRRFRRTSWDSATNNTKTKHDITIADQVKEQVNFKELNFPDNNLLKSLAKKSKTSIT